MKTLNIETKNRYSEKGTLILTTNDVLLLGDCRGTKKYKWTGEKKVTKSIYGHSNIVSYVFEPKAKKGAKYLVGLTDIIHAKGTHKFNLAK